MSSAKLRAAWTVDGLQLRAQAVALVAPEHTQHKQKKDTKGAK